MNQKLKPLNHKQIMNNQIIKPPAVKGLIGKPNDNLISSQKSNKKPLNVGPTSSLKSQKQPSREIKTPMKMQRTSTKKIEAYDCDDDFECNLEDYSNDKYFQSQLEKNIKQQALTMTKKQPMNKALIVLPKLESDIKMKGINQLQKQMDLQMSRLNLNQDDQMY